MDEDDDDEVKRDGDRKIGGGDDDEQMEMKGDRCLLVEDNRYRFGTTLGGPFNPP